MHFSKLVPNVFYKNLNSGLKTFVDCLEFTITYDERARGNQFCVVEKDGLRVNLLQDKKYAAEHHPEFRLVTDDIEGVYKSVKARHPELLHPNLSVVTLRPWGAREFAITDDQLGVVIQQWP